MHTWGNLFESNWSICYLDNRQAVYNLFHLQTEVDDVDRHLSKSGGHSSHSTQCVLSKQTYDILLVRRCWDTPICSKMAIRWRDYGSNLLCAGHSQGKSSADSLDWQIWIDLEVEHFFKKNYNYRQLHTITITYNCIVFTCFHRFDLVTLVLCMGHHPGFCTSSTSQILTGNVSIALSRFKDGRGQQIASQKIFSYVHLCSVTLPQKRHYMSQSHAKNSYHWQDDADIIPDNDRWLVQPRNGRKRLE